MKETYHPIASVEMCIRDSIDTAGTLVEGAEALYRRGAKEIYACATHPVFSEPAFARIENSCLREVVVTNTIEVSLSLIHICSRRRSRRNHRSIN